jgi:hypothetical protein
VSRRARLRLLRDRWRRNRLRFARHRLVEVLGKSIKSRNSMEICIFFVLALATGRQALGLEELPRSLDHAGAFPWGQVAASMLCLGCVISLVGIFWKYESDGLLIEQFGLILAGFGCAFYALAAWNMNGLTAAAFAVGMSLGIATACTVRWCQIEYYVQTVKAANAAEKHRAEEV